jgi:hypothetical protein
MFALPPAAEPLIQSFAAAFTRPSFCRFVTVCVGAIVTYGRRSVSRILWTLGNSAAGHPSSYHRLFSHARWSIWQVGKALAAADLAAVPADQAIHVAIDDTVTEHTGRKVWGKACHRDAVRSGKGQPNVKKWGHRWVVLAILIKFPFCSRYWALPVLCALYRKDGKNRKTACELARGLLATLLHWFPDRRFIVLADGGFSSHDLAAFCHRHRERLTLIARSRSDPCLYAMPVVPQPCRQTLWRRSHGRFKGVRCRTGRKVPAPARTAQQAAALRPLPQVVLNWYGNSLHRVQIFSACGGWYGKRDHRKENVSLLPVRWVCVRDSRQDSQAEPKRDNWFYCTDVELSPRQIVEYFAGRWSIEVTFEEVRAHLGLQTIRQRCATSVLRTTPCLFGLFSVVSLIFAQLLRQGRHGQKKPLLHCTPCYQKAEPTFADALYAVRRSLWDGCLLEHWLGRKCLKTLPRHTRQTILTYFAEAA